ncbi:MAG: cyclic nucleotide-binding domain-containing protein [Pseudomonadota bacterium]
MLDLTGYEAAAYAGVALQLLGYSLVMTGAIRGSGYLYAGINLFAATLILAGVIHFFNPSTAISQSFVFILNCYGLTRAYLLTNATKLSLEEKSLVDDIMPDLSRIAARRLFRAGRWIKKNNGDVLTREGEVLGQLLYLAEGEAEVSVQGRVIGKVGPGALLGEISMFTGGPVTATVTATQKLRLFSLSADAISTITKRDHELRVNIDAAITRALCDKLLAQNARLVAGDALNLAS